MEFLFENPLRIIFIGVVVEAVLGIVLFRSGRGVFLWAMIGVLALTVMAVTVERLVVTERERIEMTLDGITSALEANDLNRVLGYIAPNATHTRNRAAWAMRRIEFQSVGIYSLNITINRLTGPMTARAAFFGHVSYRDRQAEIPYGNYGSRFIVNLRKEGEAWVVTGHVEEQEYDGQMRVMNTE
jgi:hypothetical protein